MCITKKYCITLTTVLFNDISVLYQKVLILKPIYLRMIHHKLAHDTFTLHTLWFVLYIIKLAGSSHKDDLELQTPELDILSFQIKPSMTNYHHLQT